MIQFNNPNILYALIALIIPLLVHLFQLRKFKKTEFTNVHFLKEITLQSRKSSRIKKWLILLVRLLILFCIIIAFSEPKFKNENYSNKEKEFIFYFDNSISNKEKGEKGELLKVSIQEFINEFPNDKKINLFTNNDVFKNKSIKEIKTNLINLKYTNKQLDYKNIALKAEQFLSNQKTLKELIVVSDFQKNHKLDSTIFSNNYKTTLIQKLPISKSNISIDTAYFVKNNNETLNLKVIVKKQHSTLKNIPISIYDNDKLISKSTLELASNKNEIIFDLQTKKQLNLKIVIQENSSLNDNQLFVINNKEKKLNVLAIGNATTNLFLSKIFQKDEFNFKQQTPQKIGYSIFEKQNLIILNELDTLTDILIKNIIKYTKNGGTILIIPSESGKIKNYNKILNVFKIVNENKTRLTNINVSHPIYSNVFERKVNNFQYPFFKKHYRLKNYESTILSFENTKPLLVYAANAYIFSAALNTKNTNFKQSPLIVPTLYNVAKSTYKNNVPYYIIGNENNIDFDLNLEKDQVISLSNNKIDFIPLQKIKNNLVTIKTTNNPSLPGIYNLNKKGNKTDLFVAYNYNKNESIREYHSLNNFETRNIKVNTSLKETLSKINSDDQIGALWKWFIIFALLLLIVELLILKYFK